MFVCCYCSKNYKREKSFNKHEQQCKKKNDTTSKPQILKQTIIKNSFNNSNDSKQTNIEMMFYQLLEENKKIRYKLEQVENQLKTLKYNTKKNINDYLNDLTEEAIDLSVFIGNVQISYQDFLQFKKDGFIKGYTDLFKKYLDDSEKQSPFAAFNHKKNTVYVYSNEKWNPLNDTQLNKIIKKFQAVYITHFGTWKNEAERENISKIISQLTGSNERDKSIKKIKNNIYEFIKQ